MEGKGACFGKLSACRIAPMFRRRGFAAKAPVVVSGPTRAAWQCRPVRANPMTIDDYKRMLETQEALRRAAAAPLADAYRQAELLNAPHRLAGFDSVTAQMMREADDRRRLLGLMPPIGIAGIDSVGLTRLAAQADTHRKLLAGPMDDYRRSGIFDTASQLPSCLDTALTAYQTYEHLFRLPEAREAARLALEATAAVTATTKLYGLDRSGLALEAAMRSMHAPWLLRD